MVTHYCLDLYKKDKSVSIAVTAKDSGHAQAQALDITRALQTDTFSLRYKKIKESAAAELFRRLAFNDFGHKECDEWSNSCCNGSPVLYLLGKRYYIRPMILDYLEIHKEGCVKPSCGKSLCINPYHNCYKKMKASKLGDADTNLALAFLRQGVPVKEIARALNVHRSTIYRKIKDERIHSGAARHLRSAD